MAAKYKSNGSKDVFSGVYLKSSYKKINSPNPEAYKSFKLLTF